MFEMIYMDENFFDCLFLFDATFRSHLLSYAMLCY